MDIDSYICCPTCKGHLLTIGKNGKEETGYKCDQCSRIYPVVKRIIDLLSVEDDSKSLGQELMECFPLVDIYEGKWWRSNAFFPFFGGIDLKNEMRLIEKIVQIKSGDTVLDLGCGPGLFCRYFAGKEPDSNVIGFDLSRPMLESGVRKAERERFSNICFIRGDAHHLPFKDNTMDAVNCSGALYLFKDAAKVLSEVKRVLKTDGRFSLSVYLGQRDPFSIWKSYWDEKVWGIRSYSEKKLQELLMQAGFTSTVYHAKGLWMVVGAVEK